MAAARLSSPPPRARKVLAAALPVTEDEFIVNVTTAVSGDIVGQLLVTRRQSSTMYGSKLSQLLGLDGFMKPPGERRQGLYEAFRQAIRECGSQR